MQQDIFHYANRIRSVGHKSKDTTKWMGRGAGGISLSAVQIAKALSATVIATAGSEKKRQELSTKGDLNLPTAPHWKRQGWWM
ncbi:hypothetical protein V1523DRAFT_428643 [Lipomyces doorenjongii]